MKHKTWWIAGVGLASILSLVVVLDGSRRASRAALDADSWYVVSDAELPSLSRGRSPADPARVPFVPLPKDGRMLGGPDDLARLMEWMHGLGEDELRRLSNADYDFRKSELVEKLQALKGAWVVSTLGNLAVSEGNVLVKAILIEGLVGRIDPERLDDEHLLPILGALMDQMGRSDQDPYRVADALATSAFGACLRGGEDYVAMVGPHLFNADNASLLIHGYLHMGQFANADETLKLLLATHPSPEGRFGVLEGLRQAAVQGRIAPEAVTALGLEALGTETNERNRLLLYEMMVKGGGEDALTALETGLRTGEITELDKTVELLAMKMEPARVKALLDELFERPELEPFARQALYNAMGLLPGEEGARFLLAMSRNAELGAEERLNCFRALWNRELDASFNDELRGVLENEADPALRAEALRMLASGADEVAGFDLRSLAVLDQDPALRAEAVQLAAMRPSDDTEAWLEERLLEDDSFEVKAAALGALVYQAHYAGGGEKALGYLAQARKLTSDEGELAMIAEGERMVRDHDPRALDLDLAHEAAFWSKVSRYTDGPAARTFERQARQLSSLVASLRSTRDGRRSAR